METIPPYPTGPGQRVLAAIVFTDVVNFSARMQAQEDKTLRLLERDFAEMRRICDKYSGTVLKTTGDGLLLYFSSAVQAVACALKIQKYLAEKARALPPSEVLAHRIGIHLGDVVVNDQDVMGDGVNIASRLQAEAEPGGICISQTVYDVVKNKLALKATRLGPRELKNITDAVPVYRLLMQAQAIDTADSAAPRKTAAPVTPSPPSARTRKLTLAAGLALLLALAFAVRTHLREKNEQARADAARAAFTALLDGNDDEASKENYRRMIRVLRDWREELRENRSRWPEEYNFAAMARSLRTPAAAGAADTPARQQALQRMQTLFIWLGTALQHYTRENPLAVTELSGTAPKAIKVFAGADRRLYYTEGGATRQREWKDQKPPVLGAIIAGALLDAPFPPPREVVQGAQVFAAFYVLPELNEALRQGRLPRGPR